ncbi:MarR family winged helix-turn-helix transcriptional regulator [Actinokineospora bangkokensis]|uniref:HTH marR-type domain-containing protein n=1 Tax=Actinokineospora bangkokensis TaxID=1193682 RepID=A0A1Q9LNB6_9PSEU|nr:MarR family winged helix-turn-helix transcriptional regulator [Actinokineospora bangkokensis]OLR93546.1 hypothetical protein BJP25_14715 [Actinokineospora bangkokensis]
MTGEWSEQRLDGLPLWTLVRASHLVGQDFGQLFARHRLSPVQFGVLAQLAAAPGLTQTELARRVLVRPQSMAELIGGLVERGLLVREGPGGRGRPVPLGLTDDGLALLRAAERDVVEFNSPGALGLTAAEAGQLNALLHRVIATRRPGA